MKRFRLLLLVSSLLAVTGCFTACNTDITDDYPVPTVSLEPGESGEKSISFTIHATGADEVYYWVVKEGDDDPTKGDLNLTSATLVDAQLDVEVKETVKKSGLAAETAYRIYAYAKNFGHNVFATPITVISGAAAPLPAVEVKVVEDSVSFDSFSVSVTTSNVVKAAWLLVPKYTEGVNVAQVFEKGTALAAGDLNKTVTVAVTGLEQATGYDVYVAVESQNGATALSEVVGAVTTVRPPKSVELVLDTLFNTTHLMPAVNLPGEWIILGSSNSEAMASIIIFDYSSYTSDENAYLAAGMYPIVAGSIDMGSFPSVSCLMADPGYCNFTDAEGNTYFPVADLPDPENAMPYGVDIMTAMPTEDNNMFTFNIPAVDEDGNPAIITGSYMGPVGYSVTPPTWPFNLEQFGFDEFNYSSDGDVVVLRSSSINGDMELVLNTNGEKWDEIAYVVGEGGNFTGSFTSYLEGAPEKFVFTSGRISFEKVEGNNYLLHVSTRGAEWIMDSGKNAYRVEPVDGGYPVVINLPEPLSVDKKQWQLPADIAMALVENSAAVIVLDLGVSVPEQFIVGVSEESIYGPQAAGYWTPMAMANYSVTPTDETSGNIIIKTQNMFGEVQESLVPYSNLTETSVQIDFTNVFGVKGEGPCTLYTDHAPLGGGGGGVMQ